MAPQGGQTVPGAGAVGTLIAMGAGIVFAAAVSGNDPVARSGGAVWVFILTWIIQMPVLTPWLKVHPDRQAPASRGDRVLVALIVVASATFVAAVLWLLAGLR